MFAGAAREAVFSNPDVIRRVNADFVPVALKAGLVNNPPNDDEGRLYREIGRSKVAPQGICVVNSAGKVLAWAMMFDEDKSVLDFLDHASKRFAEYPDARKSFAAERFMKYPSNQMEDVEDNGKVLPVPEHHAAGKHCPGTPPIRRGTVIARVFGRALDKDGKPVKDTILQEHYVEDRFQVPVGMQEELAKALVQAGTGRLRLSDDLTRLLVSHAYLGQIDVQPCVCMIKDQAENKGNWKRCEFWAQRMASGGRQPPGQSLTLWRIKGESEVVSELAITSSGVHNVKLTWEGFIEMKCNGMTRLLLAARGNEKLQSSKDDHPLKREKRDAVAFLPAGHPVDLESQVRYGIIGEPVPDEETGGAEKAGGAQGATQEIPDEARKGLVEALGGGPFLVFRDKVQEELKLSDDQKHKLLEKFPDHVQEIMKVFEKIKDLKPEEREKEMQSHRQKSHEKLAAFLKETLKAEQLKRLPQLELQQQGLFALGRPEIMKELKIADEQRQQFMGVVQEMQKRIEPLIKEAGSGGNPQEIRPKVMKIRKAHEDKIEAILSDAQKKQWREMLGKPFDLGD